MCFALGFMLLGSLEGAVRTPVVQQSLAVLAVNLRTFALAVGSIGSAYIRAFIPLQADPAQRVKNHLLAAGYKPCTVRILNAQHKPAATLLGKHIVQQTDIRGADMRVARGRRRDPHSHRSFRTIVI